MQFRHCTGCFSFFGFFSFLPGFSDGPSGSAAAAALAVLDGGPCAHHQLALACILKSVRPGVVSGARPAVRKVMLLRSCMQRRTHVFCWRRRAGGDWVCGGC